MTTPDETKTITLTIAYDHSCENPLTYDGMWTLHRFAGGWHGKGPTEFFTDRGDRHNHKWLPDTLDLFWKLRNGLAWTVGGYFDGGSQGISVYVQEYDPADKIAGLLVWEHPEEDMGAKTREERGKDAASTLAEYERWANGECFGWIINDGEADEDSCWGYVGAENIRECVALGYVPDERPLRVVLTDELTESVMGSALDKIAGVESLTHAEWREEERAYLALAREEAGELGDSERLDKEAA